ncbi:MAG: hypothetical protein HFI72_03315 [Peptococcaceae bacterium]|jgi:hypothetical protein|nr:hypothetical protein [Peptococcaceae bacterium]
MKNQEQNPKAKEQLTVNLHSVSDALLENIMKDFLRKKARQLAANQARVIK